LFLGLGWFWWDSLKVREKTVAVSRCCALMNLNSAAWGRNGAKDW